MEIFDGYRALFRPLRQPAVAIGNFDGVHLGHRALLDRTVELARTRHGDAVALTFEPHPVAVMAPHAAPLRLTPVTRKLELIGEQGIDVCVVEPFTAELASVPPQQFVDDVLRKVMNAQVVIVGHDFRFGKDRSGDTEFLRRAGRAGGFEIVVVEAVVCGTTRVSSSVIRDCLLAGEVGPVCELLGRPYDVDGQVHRGATRGTTIGFPTANIALDAQLLPGSGVYAVWVEDLTSPWATPRMGAANIGTNPTFEDAHTSKLEVHVLDFDGDLYGHRLRVRFVERLRDERRFSSVEALVEQLGRDVEQAAARLAADSP